MRCHCGTGCEPERCWSGDALNKCRDFPLSNDGVVEAASAKTSDHHEDLAVKAGHNNLSPNVFPYEGDVLLFCSLSGFELNGLHEVNFFCQLIYCLIV